MGPYTPTNGEARAEGSTGRGGVGGSLGSRNGGALKTIGSEASAIDGDVLIHNGDVWIGVSSANTTGTLNLTGATSNFTMDGGTYHCTVDAAADEVDLIWVANTAFIGGNAQIQVNVVNGGGLQAGDTFTVLTALVGVNLNSNFQSSDPTWVPWTLNDGHNLNICYIS